MQRIYTVFVSLSAAVAILLLLIAGLLIWSPEMLVTDFRIGVTIACGIFGFGILIPLILTLHVSVQAKQKANQSTHG